MDELSVPVLLTKAARFQSWLDVEAALAGRRAAHIGSGNEVMLPGFVNGHHHIGFTPVQLGSPDMVLNFVVGAVGYRCRTVRFNPAGRAVRNGSS
jgi:hypothetical protein